MNIYVIELIFIIGMAQLCGDKTKKDRKIYIVLCALFLGMVLILRTPEVGADIGRYRTHFAETGMLTVPEILNSYNNVGFYLYDHYMFALLNGNYQIYLIITGLITFIPVVWLIGKYSAKPYYSFLVWFCMGYYAFQFSGLKQAMAMAILCFAFHFAMEAKPFKFCLLIILASFFHLPAIIFFSAYLIVNFKFTKWHLLFYSVAIFLVWAFRDALAVFLSEGYDSVVETEAGSDIGGKVILIILFILLGVLLRCPSNDDVQYKALLQFMAIAAVIQLLAVYGNVFERLADYYFFFIILFIPRVMEPKYREDLKPVLKSDGADRIFYAVALTGIFILYYWIYGYNTPGMLPHYTWI